MLRQASVPREGVRTTPNALWVKEAWLNLAVSNSDKENLVRNYNLLASVPISLLPLSSIYLEGKYFMGWISKTQF